MPKKKKKRRDEQVSALVVNENGTAKIKSDETTAGELLSKHFDRLLQRRYTRSCALLFHIASTLAQ